MGLQPLKSAESRWHERITFTKYLLISVLFILLINIPSTSAEIRHIQISSRTKVRYIVFDDFFFFTNKGHISINISSISLTPPLHKTKTEYNSSLAIFATSRTFFKKAIHRAIDSKTCILSEPFIKPFFTLVNSPSLHSASFGNNAIELKVPDPGAYEVFLLNCNPTATLSINMRLEMYEIIETGEKSYVQKNYLMLPLIYSISCLAFFLLLVIWVVIGYHNKLSVRKIHLLMGMFLLIKWMELFCHAETRYAIQAFGTSHGWKILWHALHLFQGTLVLMIICLIGDGWSYMRPNLSQDAKCWMLVFFMLHMLSSACYIASKEFSGRYDINYRGYVVGAKAFDILAWIISTVRPIGSMIQYLLEDFSMREGKARKGLKMLKRMRNLMFALYGHLFINKFGVQLVAKFMLNVNPQANWKMLATVEQVLEISFYVVVFFTFRPNHQDDNLWPKWLGSSSDDVIPNKYDEAAARSELQNIYYIG